MGGGLESRYVGHVYGADGVVQARWAYVPETYRAKNILIKFPSCIKLAFHIYYRVSSKMLVIRSLNIAVVPDLVFCPFLPASRPQDVRACN